MEADYLQNFKLLDNAIQNNEILTIKRLSNILNKNYEYSKQILFEYFSSRKNLENYVVIFNIQLYENSCLKNIYIPSYSGLLASLLSNYEILDFFVWAILKRDIDFHLKDLSVFYDSNDIYTNFVNNGTAFDIQDSTNINTLNSGNQVKIPESNKEFLIKTDVVTSINNKEDTHGKINKQEKIIEKKPTVSKKNQEKINFPFNISSHNVKSSTIETVSQYEEGESITSKEKVLTSFENKFKINEEENNGEEEHFYGGKIITQPQQIKQEPSIPTNKRKASPGNEEKIEKRKKEDAKMKSEATSSDSEQIKTNSQNEKKKVLKIRKVKKTSYATDEKGYLHSIDEYVDEEYWSDELKPLPKKILQIEEKKTKGKKGTSGQGNILNFFGKK